MSSGKQIIPLNEALVTANVKAINGIVVYDNPNVDPKAARTFNAINCQKARLLQKYMTEQFPDLDVPIFLYSPERGLCHFNTTEYQASGKSRA
jgi:hypothetical protein